MAAYISPSKEPKNTYKALTKMGVNIRLSSHVKNYADDIVTLNNGDTIPTKSLIWASGVIPIKINGLPDGSYGKSNRLLVDEFNKIISTNNIYAIGDACLQTTDVKFEKGHPQVAQVAIQHGKTLAKNLMAKRNHKPLQTFLYFNKGSMAIIGRNKAVLDFPGNKIHFNGFIAFMAWVFIHLVWQVSYRNILKTFYNWIGAYLPEIGHLE